MLTLIKRALPYTFILGIIGLLGVTIGMSGLSLVNRVVINGQTMYVFNLRAYFENINIAFGGISDSFMSRFTSLTLKWDGITECAISIVNCLIATLNVLTLPFCLGAQLISVGTALVGLPCNDTNFMYSALNTFSTLYIPYIPYSN